MAKPSALSLLLLFLALPIASLAARQRYERQTSEQCRSKLEAVEPTRRLESEGGHSEFWDHNSEQFQCAGVSAARHTIQPRGLLLPSSSNSPRLVYVLEGQGIGGIVIPGCPESYSSSPSEETSRRQIQGRRLGRYGEERSYRADQHQKVHHLRKGDIIAVPAGAPAWSYNNGDNPLVVVSIMDTSNYINQLDNTPRRFFVGGRFSQQRGSQQRGSESRRRGEQEVQEQSFGNIFDGFDTELIAEALGISKETASKLQSREGRKEQKGMIIRVEEGLQMIKPRESEEVEYEEEEEEEERRRGRRALMDYEEERRRGRRGSREEQEEEEERRRERRGSTDSEEEEERKRGRRGSEEEQERRRERRGSRRSEEEERRRSNVRGRRGEREREEEERRRGSESREERRRRGFANGIEETICTLKFKLNIGNPRHSDLYSTEAGRLTTLNSFKLPLLDYIQLSADVGLLRRNAIMGPKWNTNAHSIKYVIRGSAHVQIVDSNGNSVMDEMVNQGQMFVVPQNFVEVTRAEDEEYEWVSFHTTDFSISNHLAGKGSTLRGIPVDVLANSFDISREEARDLKQGRSRELAVFAPRSHHQYSSSRERRLVAEF